MARGGGLDYPKWLAYTTGVLEQENKEVRLIDAVARKWNRETVLKDAGEFSPDLIVVDSNFASLHNDIEVTTLLKEATGATTVLVGPPTSQFPDRILQGSGVDIVARCECDFTIRDIASEIEKGESVGGIKGISYKENGRIVHTPDREFASTEDLDRIPFVSKIYKDHLDIKQYFLSQSLYPEVQIFTGRGCPYRCTFCSTATLQGKKLRARSVKNVVDEFEYISRELPQVKEIFIEDDTFTIDKGRVKGICEEIKRRKLNVTWSCNARADLDYETMKQMKKAGCRLIIVGYESGNDKILKDIKKGFTTDQMRGFTREAKKAGLMVHGDFIIGLPGETRETAGQTYRFIKELKPNILQVAVATPIPGTEFYDWVKNNGFLLTDDMEKSIDAQGYQNCMLSYPEFSKEDIDKHVDKTLKGYYLSPSYVPIALSNIFRKNGLQELKLIMKSAKGFLKYLGGR
ncbi:B12-binding domain-containing radical SAM protein [Chloroflexota bacterium]